MKLTTARLVSIDRTSHPRVMGGICTIQSSMPTGIFDIVNEIQDRARSASIY